MSNELSDQQRQRIQTAGAIAAELCAAQHYAFVKCEPGDATQYQFIVIDTGETPDRYVLASNFGAAYPIPGHFNVDPGYAAVKYLSEPYRNVYTGYVYATFIAAFGKATNEQ